MQGNRESVRLAYKLIITASVLHLAGYVFAAPPHAMDEAWPNHARFHIIQSIMWVAGLDLTAIILAYSYDLSEQKWIRRALWVIFVTSFLGYYIAILIFPAGRPPELAAHLLLAVPTVLYLVGMGKTYFDLRVT